MEEKDQPLGAPNFHTETPLGNSEPNVQKPKRKLNWKGFGIGIIAVILIEFFAVSMLQMGEPQITLPPNGPMQNQPSPAIESTVDWKTYTSSESAYSFKHPKTWNAERLGKTKFIIFVDQKRNKTFLKVSDQTLQTPFPRDFFITTDTKQVTQRDILVDNTPATEYTQTFIVPPGTKSVLGVKNGDVNIVVVIERKDSRLVLQADKSQKQILDTILTTLKFTD